MNKFIYHILISFCIMVLFPQNMRGGANDGRNEPDFDYPQQVSATALADLNVALKAKDGAKTVDALVRYALAEGSISEENMGKIISRVDSVIAVEKRPDIVALLYFLEAHIFYDYERTYGVWDRKNAADEALPSDYSEWDRAQFERKIEELIKKSMSNPAALQASPLTKFANIIEYDEQGLLYEPTLFEFLSHRAIVLKTELRDLFLEPWIEFEKQQNNIPALLYVYGKLDFNEKSILELYDRFKHNEHSGLLLENLWSSKDYYSLFNDYVKRFPDSYYTPAIENKIKSIEEKVVMLRRTSEHRSSTDTISVEVFVYNVNHGSVNLYCVPDNIYEKIKRKEYVKVSQLKLVKTLSFNVEGQVPFKKVHKMKIGTLDYGRYLLLPSFEQKGSLEERVVTQEYFNDIFSVFDITTMAVTASKQKGRIFALDARTGKPLSGITLKSEKFTGKTGIDGSMVVPDEIEEYTDFYAINGKDKYGPALRYRRFRESQDENRCSADIYTDLAIYRPGETLKFATIVYETTATTRMVKAGEAIKVTLFDSNSKVVDTLSLVTDEFGRVEGSFKIPTDRLNGDWRIYVRNNHFGESKNVNVSEYKTPSFTVDFVDTHYSYVAKQPVKIAGKVMTYSGMPVANTKVQLCLSSHAWSWWWRYENATDGNVLNDSTVTTDSEGNFSIEYPASMFEKEQKSDWSSYKLQAQVTTDAGEIQENMTSFVIGYRRGLSFSSRYFEKENSRPVVLPVTFNSTDENEKSATCTYMITTQDGKLAKAGTFVTDKPEIDLTALPSAKYKIEAQIAGDTTTVTAAQVMLYRKNDKTAPESGMSMWLPNEGKYVDEKDVAHVIIGTSVAESHIYYVATSRTQVLKQGWLRYKPGMHDFSIQIPNRPDEYVYINFYNAYDGEKRTESCRLDGKANKQKLTVKVAAFRDKLVPGTTEKWQFQLLDKNNKPVKGALMLEMFDKALNDLADNMWNLSVWYNYLGVPATMTLMNDDNYNKFITVSWRASLSSTNSCTIPYFYFYHRDFFSYTDRYMLRKGLAYEVCKAASVGSMRVEKSAEGENALEESKDGLGVVVQDAVSETVSQSSAQTGQRSLDKVKLRENDVKTALWHPMLVSDAQGNISLEFNVPEFNTTWIMQAIGYTSNLVTDAVHREVLTQKPVMVKSSLPRFLRSGDKVTLAANVQNATDEIARCAAAIELFDPRTGKLYATRSFSEQVKSKGTNVVTIDWNVPDTIPFVGFRIKATSGNFSDGEQVMIPVLPDVAPVIETQPFYIDAAQSQFSLQLPEFKKDSRVTLEYCDNPVWYCVTALPTIFSDNFHISSCLAHSLYAEVLAQGVAKSQPQIREAINYWKAHPEDSTLVSMLAKNGDLKIGTLLASPFLNDAERQSLRMSKLDELFDEVKMRTVHQKIIEGLQDLQMSDGGWCWYKYKNCSSSLYATAEILEIIGELRHLGYLKNDVAINSMVAQAVKYFDAKKLEQFMEQQKHDKNNFSGFSDYVYIRTLFNDEKLPKANADMMKKCLSAMTKDWKGLSLSSKAYFAMALNRNGYRQVAKNIMESVRQFAIIKPELGMYWDNLQSRGWQYFDKVAVTSSILQAFNEIDARQGEIDLIRKWILLMKQSNDWGTSSLAANAVYSILATGSQWLQSDGKTDITINGQPVEFGKMARYVGYGRKQIDAVSGAVIKIERNGNSPAWGAVYCQFKAPMTRVEEHAITEVSIHKEYYTYATDGSIHPATSTGFKVGDKVQVRTVIKNNKDLDYVTVTDERGACFEPVDQLSGYRWADRSCYYLETKDAQTNIFFDDLQKGTHVISYDVYVTAPGKFAAGIATVQCQYAPQLTAHSAGEEIEVRAK